MILPPVLAWQPQAHKLETERAPWTTMSPSLRSHRQPAVARPQSIEPHLPEPIIHPWYSHIFDTKEM